MSDRLSGSDRPSAWHRLIERYTPDGILGRLLLGAVGCGVSASALTLAVWGAVTFTPLSLAFALLTGVVGLAAGVLGVTTLWPVYLSLIGNVDSPAAYAERVAGSPAAVSAGCETDEDDVARLKRRYAAGDLSEGEFERRLDRLLEADERVRRRDDDRHEPGTTAESGTSAEPEPTAERSPSAETDR